MKRQLSQRNSTAKEIVDCLHKFHKLLSGINKGKTIMHGINTKFYRNKFHYQHYWEKISQCDVFVYLFVCLFIYKGFGFHTFHLHTFVSDYSFLHISSTSVFCCNILLKKNVGV